MALIQQTSEETQQTKTEVSRQLDNVIRDIRYINESSQPILLERVVDLTPDDIEGLDTDFEILPPAVGTDAYYDVAEIILELTPGATPYVSTDDLQFIGCFSKVIDAVFMEREDKTVLVYRSMAGTLDIINVNSDLRIFAANGTAPTGGDGTLRIIVYYYERTFNS